MLEQTELVDEKVEVDRVQLYPCPFLVPCDIYGCRNMAKWHVGRPDGPRNTQQNLCDSCAESLVERAPRKFLGGYSVDQLLILADENRGLHEHLAETEQRCNELVTTNESLLGEIRELREALSAQQKEITRLRSEIASKEEAQKAEKKKQPSQQPSGKKK